MVVKRKFNFNDYYQYLNGRNKNIKFTYALKNKLPFLDLLVSIKNNKLHFTCYQKPLNKYLYIPKSSSHPPSLKRGFIKGELIRYARNSSTQEDFNKMSTLFQQRLHARGYSKAYLSKILLSISYSDRPAFVNPQDQPKLSSIPFKIRYSNNIGLCKIPFALHETFDTVTSAYRPSPTPLLIYCLKSNPSIGSILTRLHSKKKEITSSKNLLNPGPTRTPTPELPFEGSADHLQTGPTPRFRSPTRPNPSGFRPKRSPGPVDNYDTWLHM
jgi:hypothetical protein